MSQPTHESFSALRLKLKCWEQDFTSKHGRKPSRDDIKNNAQIAEQYKQFNRARRPKSSEESGRNTTPRKAAEHHNDQAHPLIERCVNIDTSAQPMVSSTPQKQTDPTKQKLFESTPLHIRCALGPTPQKDGHVLGLFDTLPALSASLSPPVEDTDEVALLNTPRKGEARAGSDSKPSRTPRSSGRRFFLDAFAGTPRKRKRDEEDIGTPSSLRDNFATPAFLRRERSSDVSRDDSTSFTTTAGRRRKGIVRSLSTIIANLRANEEQRMDEEWDIMRELEDPGFAVTERAAAETTDTLVEDSQAPDMPLGPDQAIVADLDSSDHEPDAGRKVWKKKGLKRQTKRVSMKPVLHTPRRADGVREMHDTAGQSKPEETATGVVKKALRKVNEAAHMNFRRLKIKNKNSKAAGRGRFSRR